MASKPLPAFVKVWVLPVARIFPAKDMSPVAVIVMERAPLVSVSPQIFPLIVTKPLPELVKPSLVFPEPLPLTAEIVTP